MHITWERLGRCFECGITSALSGTRVARPNAESRLETCFGLYFGRHAVLDACVKQRVDFNAPCPGPSPDPEHPLRPLDIAILTRDAHAVRLLLENGADVKRVDRPVHRLVHRCFNAANTGVCREIAALLVQHGANLEELGPSKGWRETPLIMAWHMNRPFGQALLELGANINGSDNQGCTLLDLAYDRKDAMQIALLEGRGAKRGRMCTTNRAVKRAKDWSSGLGYLLCVFVPCNTH